MLLAILLLVFWRAPALLVLVAGLSFTAFLFVWRGDWTPDGRFGPANAVTTFRFAWTLLMLLAYPRMSGAALALASVLPLALDGVDGWLARRRRCASEFGALYDVEADAFFVVALPAILWMQGITGPWVLIAGAWRYVYLLWFALVPARAPDRTRTRLGRLTYIAMITCFLMAFVLPPPLARAGAAAATVAVSASFLRSFWERHRPRRIASTP